jgi:hypothetical protein
MVIYLGSDSLVDPLEGITSEKPEQAKTQRAMGQFWRVCLENRNVPSYYRRDSDFNCNSDPEAPGNRQLVTVKMVR